MVGFFSIVQSLHGLPIFTTKLLQEKGGGRRKGKAENKNKKKTRKNIPPKASEPVFYIWTVESWLGCSTYVKCKAAVVSLKS